MCPFSFPFLLALLTSRSLESIFSFLEVYRHLCLDESPLDTNFDAHRNELQIIQVPTVQHVQMVDRATHARLLPVTSRKCESRI